MIELVVRHESVCYLHFLILGLAAMPDKNTNEQEFKLIKKKVTFFEAIIFSGCQTSNFAYVKTNIKTNGFLTISCFFFMEIVY